MSQDGLWRCGADVWTADPRLAAVATELAINYE
jgi:hypothetical protein